MFLNGCAETRIYEDGRLVCVMQGDATNVTLRTYRGGYFHADAINHSDATKAMAANIGTGISAVGGIAAAVGTIVK